MEETTPIQPQVTIPNPTIQKPSNPWKYLMVALLLIILGIGSFVLMKKNTKQPTIALSPQLSIQPTITNIPPLTPSPTIHTLQTVSGGKITAGEQTAIFSQYTLTLAPGWTGKHQIDSAGKTDTLTLSKGGNLLAITQNASGSAGTCVSPEETPKSRAQVFTSFVDIASTSTLKLRRGLLPDRNYSVCEYKTDSFVFPTSFGYVTYIAIDKSLLPEMDEMLASLTK